MGETFRLSLNLPAVVKSLADLAYQQVPYATAVALTRTAQDAQAAVKASLRQKFTIRNTWVERGIRIERAEKRDWPHCKASVWDKDAFMALQETGGEKVARGRSLARPVRARVTPQTILSPGKWPRALLRRKGVFVQQLSGGKWGLFQRTGSTHETAKLLYVFEPRVHVRPRFGFETTIKAAVDHTWAKNFEAALSKAVATAR